MAYEFQSLAVRVERGVAWVTIDNPPINLFDLVLMRDMDAFGREVENDEAVRAIVFQSANPEFFIAHADIELIQRMPTTPPPRPERPSFFQAMCDRFRTMPKATIAKIEGCARGGGSEFSLSLDMRFAALGRAVLGQPEVAIGIIPGGSGTQRLPRLLGRSRALEIVLGCDDFDAATAERYGYVNRALPPDELGPFVERLAYRIASFPAEAIALAKAAVVAADDLSTTEGLVEEAHNFNLSVATAGAQTRMRRAMELGAQTRDVELTLGALFDRMQGGES
ncbi:MAG: enoyl-CoA hydratase/isomerase family protein [Dehalococcoidia bacterium]|nr:enoyl-CoA hydratase/isomerase family protein [Dehalococcoidia bacterium]NUQ55274.1 enoyl-CoA hydratase/isomerase family protein [Dehalococcoidia bacterium]